MKKNLISLVLLLIVAAACNHSANKQAGQEISIIPNPVSLVASNGAFVFDENTTYRFGGDEKMGDAGVVIHNLLKEFTGFPLEISTDKKQKYVLSFVLAADDSYGKEGYSLRVERKMITAEASAPAGLFYAMQTLLQLMPPEVFSKGEKAFSELRIPCCTVSDEPRFSWRGMHLDVSRHFFDVEFIKRYIDILAMHKMNVFHWHLTDDNGWRIEIEKYPELTEIAAWRVDRSEQPWREATPPQPGEKPSYGGYYTQEEVREVVQYAADRHVTVIPEIEMPGHTSEVFAAYPHLSCTGGTFFVQPGSYWPNVDIFCAGKEETFHFIEDVLSEVMALFPAEYVHIGGDEADKTRWKACGKCQKRIRDEGLADEHELQSWFIKRIEKFLVSNGKKLIGWDEILEGGLAPEATVMSWRGVKGGIQAARQGHQVIMSPTSHCYFDYYQANPDFEPEAIGGFLTLKKVYDFEPVPPELNEQEAAYVLGAQGNVWTEYISTPEHAEYMAIPRMTALAEVVWSETTKKDWSDFQKRLQTQFTRFKGMGVNYSSGSWQVSIQPVLQDSIYFIELASEQYQVPIHYTLDGSDPTINSSTYTDPLAISESTVVKAALFEDGVLKEYPSEKEIVFHLGLGKSSGLEFPPSPYYPGNGSWSLVDGLRGTDNFRDGYWLGFEGSGVFAEINLEKEMEVNQVLAGFLQNSGAWIFLPEMVTVSLLGADKQVVATVNLEPEATMEVRGTIVEEMKAGFESVSAQYVRLEAKGLETIPQWHDGAGNKGWLFIDEVVIR